MTDYRSKPTYRVITLTRLGACDVKSYEALFTA